MKKLLYTLVFVLTGLGSFAQQPEISLRNAPKFSLGFSPFSMFFSRVKLDLETGINTPNPILITFSPIQYLGETSVYTNSRNTGPQNELAIENDVISGVGGELQVRMAKVMDSENLFMLYGGLGVGLHNMKFSFRDYGWTPYMEDGLQYYRYQIADQQEKIKRFDVFITGGIRTYINRFIYFDMNAGIAVQHSRISSTQSYQREHRAGILDFGNQGPNLRGNLSIGFSLF